MELAFQTFFFTCSESWCKIWSSTGSQLAVRGGESRWSASLDMHWIWMDLCCPLWRIGPLVAAKYQDSVAEKDICINLQHFAHVPLKDCKKQRRSMFHPKSAAPCGTCGSQGVFDSFDPRIRTRSRLFSLPLGWLA